MKTTFSFKSALLAGIIATAVMTLFTYMSPLMGFDMNIPEMLANTMGTPVIIGWLAHFMIGIILTLSYAILFLSLIKSDASIKTGTIFGFFPWLLAQIIVMPLVNVMAGGSFSSGLFSGSFIIAMASLVGHLIYGAVLGFLYKSISQK
ncbi:MAG: DUF6789 family protein [Ignavibacteria bacterium]